MFKRAYLQPQHAEFAARVEGFLDAHVVPHHADWAARGGGLPRALWQEAGAAGLLCRTVPQVYGGPGGDLLEAAVITAALRQRRISGFLTCLQSDIVAPFVLKLGREDQKRHWLPALASGNAVGAIAMTEPQGGSDIAGIETTARRHGDSIVLNGTKTHISNAMTADVIIVAARTVLPDSGDPARRSQPAISLVMVEAERPGITRQPIDKAGMPALDTGTITFEDCVVPAANLLGAEHMGFVYLMTFLGIERLVLATYAQACAERLLRDLIADCDARKTAAGSLLDYQNTRFVLADLYSACAVNRAFVDHCLIAAQGGRSDPKAACIAKLRVTDTLRQIAAFGVQFRGAAGISGATGARASQDMLDSAVQSVWGGTSEIMRDVIGQGLASVL